MIGKREIIGDNLVEGGWDGHMIQNCQTGSGENVPTRKTRREGDPGFYRTGFST